MEATPDSPKDDKEHVAHPIKEGYKSDSSDNEENKKNEKQSKDKKKETPTNKKHRGVIEMLKKFGSRDRLDDLSDDEHKKPKPKPKPKTEPVQDETREVKGHETHKTQQYGLKIFKIEKLLKGRKNHAAAAQHGGDDSSSEGEELFAEEVLKATNRYRKRHGVKSLVINKELTTQAREWCRKVKREGSVAAVPYQRKYGQNIFETQAIPRNEISGREVVDAWYDEINDYIFVKESANVERKSDNFTQLLWKDTSEIGVAKSALKDGSLVYVTVLFNPKGNIKGTYSDQVPPIGGFATPLVDKPDSDSDEENKLSPQTKEKAIKSKNKGFLSQVRHMFYKQLEKEENVKKKDKKQKKDKEVEKDKEEQDEQMENKGTQNSKLLLKRLSRDDLDAVVKELKSKNESSPQAVRKDSSSDEEIEEKRSKIEEERSEIENPPSKSDRQSKLVPVSPPTVPPRKIKENTQTAGLEISNTEKEESLSDDQEVRKTSTLVVYPKKNREDPKSEGNPQPILVSYEMIEADLRKMNPKLVPSHMKENEQPPNTIAINIGEEIGNNNKEISDDNKPGLIERAKIKLKKKKDSTNSDSDNEKEGSYQVQDIGEKDAQNMKAKRFFKVKKVVQKDSKESRDSLSERDDAAKENKSSYIDYNPYFLPSGTDKLITSDTSMNETGKIAVILKENDQKVTGAAIVVQKESSSEVEKKLVIIKSENPENLDKKYPKMATHNNSLPEDLKHAIHSAILKSPKSDQRREKIIYPPPIPVRAEKEIKTETCESESGQTEAKPSLVSTFVVKNEHSAAVQIRSSSSSSDYEPNETLKKKIRELIVHDKENNQYFGELSSSDDDKNKIKSCTNLEIANPYLAEKAAQHEGSSGTDSSSCSSDDEKEGVYVLRPEIEQETSVTNAARIVQNDLHKLENNEIQKKTNTHGHLIESLTSEVEQRNIEAAAVLITAKHIKSVSEDSSESHKKEDRSSSISLSEGERDDDHHDKLKRGKSEVFEEENQINEIHHPAVISVKPKIKKFDSKSSSEEDINKITSKNEDQATVFIKKGDQTAVILLNNDRTEKREISKSYSSETNEDEPRIAIKPIYSPILLDENEQIVDIQLIQEEILSSSKSSDSSNSSECEDQKLDVETFVQSNSLDLEVEPPLLQNKIEGSLLKSVEVYYSCSSSDDDNQTKILVKQKTLSMFKSEENLNEISELEEVIKEHELRSSSDEELKSSILRNNDRHIVESFPVISKKEIVKSISSNSCDEDVVDIIIKRASNDLPDAGNKIFETNFSRCLSTSSSNTDEGFKETHSRTIIIPQREAIISRETDTSDVNIVNQFFEEILSHINHYRDLHLANHLSLDYYLCSLARKMMDQLVNDVEPASPVYLHGELVFHTEFSEQNPKISSRNIVDSWYQTRVHINSHEQALLKSGPFWQIICKETKEIGLGIRKSENNQRFLLLAIFKPAVELLNVKITSEMTSISDSRETLERMALGGAHLVSSKDTSSDEEGDDTSVKYRTYRSEIQSPTFISLVNKMKDKSPTTQITNKGSSTDDDFRRQSKVEKMVSRIESKHSGSPKSSPSKNVNRSSQSSSEEENSKNLENDSKSKLFRKNTAERVVNKIEREAENIEHIISSDSCSSSDHDHTQGILRETSLVSVNLNDDEPGIDTINEVILESIKNESSLGEEFEVMHKRKIEVSNTSDDFERSTSKVILHEEISKDRVDLIKINLDNTGQTSPLESSDESCSSHSSSSSDEESFSRKDRNLFVEDTLRALNDRRLNSNATTLKLSKKLCRRARQHAKSLASESSDGLSKGTTICYSGHKIPPKRIVEIWYGEEHSRILFSNLAKYSKVKPDSSRVGIAVYVTGSDKMIAVAAIY